METLEEVQRQRDQLKEDLDRLVAAAKPFADAFDAATEAALMNGTLFSSEPLRINVPLQTETWYAIWEAATEPGFSSQERIVCRRFKERLKNMETQRGKPNEETTDHADLDPHRPG